VRDGIAVADPEIMAELGVEGALSLAVTEKRTRAQLDRVVELLEAMR